MTTHLEQLICRLRRHFSRAEPLRHVQEYVEGLMARAPRRTSAGLARAAGADAPHQLQHLLGRAVWDADAVRDTLRDYVREMLDGHDALLVVGDVTIEKEGKGS